MLCCKASIPKSVYVPKSPAHGRSNDDHFRRCQTDAGSHVYEAVNGCLDLNINRVSKMDQPSAAHMRESIIYYTMVDKLGN